MHGCIPQLITNITKMHLLDLLNNKFIGRIPSHLERLSIFAIVLNEEETPKEMGIDIKGSEYNLSYILPTNTIFDLSYNNLTGEIHARIGGMNHLRLLNLSWNQLKNKFTIIF